MLSLPCVLIFLGDCAQFAGLAEAVNQGLYLTPRLNAQQLRAAIEEPAFVFDGDIEPALITQLLEDAQTNQDQLPLLQHVLMRLWDLANDKTATLTLADYQAIGGLRDALSRHADEIYNQLSNEQQRIAELLFRSLTERGDTQRDTRRPTPLTEIIDNTASSHSEVVAVIDAFRQTGCCFLMPPINVALTVDSIIDISHESLIRQWQRLKDWAADETEDAKIYWRLEDRALEWQKNKADFLKSPELQSFQQWWEEKKPTVSWAKRYGEYFVLTEEFLTSSQLVYQRLQKAEAKQRRLVIIGLVCFSVVVSGLAVFSTILYKQAKQAVKQEKMATSKAVEAQKNAENQEKNCKRAKTTGRKRISTR